MVKVKLPNRVCEKCGTPFYAAGGRRYCSRLCYQGSTRGLSEPPECPSGASLIPLTRGLWAIVDDADYSRVSKHVWSAARRACATYAAAGFWIEGRSKNDYLHRFVMNPPEGMQVDHINGNGLDNRKSNLRVCTNAQNNANHAKRRGSALEKRGVFRVGKKFRAVIAPNGVSKHIGYFHTEEEAAIAYDNAAKEAYGEFAYQNNV